MGWGSIFCGLGLLSLLSNLRQAPAEIIMAQVSGRAKEEIRRQFRERCREIDRELREQPETFNRYAEKGTCLHAQGGRPEEALPYYLEHLERRPFSPNSYHIVSDAYYKLGRYREAIHEDRRGLSLDRKNPTGHYSLAFLLEKVGEWNEALTEYREVLRWIEEHGEGTLYEGYSTGQLTRERLEEAIRRMEEKGAEKKSPEKQTLPLSEKKAADRREEKTLPQGQYAGYCRQIERQVKMTPRDPRMQVTWAFCRIHASDMAGAEAAFLAALEQDAGNPYIYHFLAAHYQRQGKFAKAVSELRRGLRQGRGGRPPFNPATLYLLAQAFEAVGRFKEAKMSYQEVAEYPALGSGKGKRYYRGARGELYPITALTPALLRARLAHVGAQAKGKEKRSEQAAAAAIVRGIVVVGEEGRQPANEGEVFLVSEELDYGEYQFVKGGAFIFTEVPIGHYMLYARAGRPPENPDRPETIWAVEIKKEKRSYAVELRLRPPLGVKPRPSPEMRRPKSSEGRKGTRSQ